ncbi:SEH-associated protein 4 [Cytospora mali]|uniref:SEH-associated protein 4 n=1 Tax=Cytospora mali TaxID=578113 RepID=A0A194VE40_CYTMA|nr:SEH-associated protein 4 [Valsa mali var. pyri (nom. inval.)]
MDRPEPGLLKWSPNPNNDSFLHVNLQHRVVQLYEPTGHARRGRFDYRKVSKHDDVPPLTTYDWSPSIPGLVAVGSSTGVVNLLRVDDNSNAYMELSLKVARTCLAVAFNTTGLLAVGLDRVRNDQCLHVWDVNRLATTHESGPGFPYGFEPFREPFRRLEHNASISSIKFFEDNPQTLVAGIKGSGLRIHDLRDGHESVINFQTKCNNNLTIDYADQNYFASSALDSPGVMVWDRRALNRSVASPSYLEAVDADDIPFGGALRLDHVMEMESDPQARSDRNSFIRKIAYCRDQRGMLAVLSRTGQLKVLSTQTSEYLPIDMESESPQLLEVKKSNEMDNFYSEFGRKNERIVSFDWLTMPSPALRPRLLVLRANGAFEILDVPSLTRTYPYKLTPWQAPYRGLVEGSGYHILMEFEPGQTSEILGPVFIENALSEIPIYGPEKVDARAIAAKALETYLPEDDLLLDTAASDTPLPVAFTQATTVAEKLRALRAYVQDIARSDSLDKDGNPGIDDHVGRLSGIPLESSSSRSNRALHEALLGSTLATAGFPKGAQIVLDHVMLLRARERYLFDCRVNRAVVADDPWLKGVWGWIEGAEEAASDGGMMSHPLDLSYLGVNTIWTNDLGERPALRIAEGATHVNPTIWERCANALCKRRGFPVYDGVATRKPYQRQLLLNICDWGVSAVTEDIVDTNGSSIEKGAFWHTRMTAHALFRGDTQEAVRILKEASKAHPELLFVSLALQLTGRGDRSVAAEQLDFDEAVAAKTDPYLRAISSYVATGDWATIANQRSLPLRDRTFVAVRTFDDAQLTEWLAAEVEEAIREGDIEGIVLTGITEKMVDILAQYVEKFHDIQTATLIMSFCAPRYIDDYRCKAWRNAYRAYLQRHKAFYQRTKFEVESTKRSKRDGRPMIKPPSRQIALRCVYCDAETSLLRSSTSSSSAAVAAAGGL